MFTWKFQVRLNSWACKLILKFAEESLFKKKNQSSENYFLCIHIVKLPGALVFQRKGCVRLKEGEQVGGRKEMRWSYPKLTDIICNFSFRFKGGKKNLVAGSPSLTLSVASVLKDCMVLWATEQWTMSSSNAQEKQIKSYS